MSDERKPFWPWIATLLMRPASERFWAWAVFLAAVDALLMATVALYPTVRDGETGQAKYLAVGALVAATATYILRPWRKA